MLKSGQSITATFTISNPSTGAAVNADSLPTGILYVNGTVNAASITVTNITTGYYKAAVTLPTLSAGDVVDLRISAAVNSIDGEGIVFSGVADTKRVSDLQDLTAAQVNAECDNALTDYDAATGPELAAVDTKIDTIDSNVDSIKSQTDKLTFTGSDVKVTLDGEEVTVTASSIICIQNGLATSTLLELAVKLLRTSYRKVAPNIIELYDTDVDVTNITTETPIETWELFDSNGDATLTDIYYFNRTTA